MSMIAFFQAATEEQIDYFMETPSQFVPFARYMRDAQPFSYLNIDKAWAGLHFLFTRFSPDRNGSLAFIEQGGIEIPEVEFGYGPARAFRAGDVQGIAHALSNVTQSDLEKQYDAEQMNLEMIYPAVDWGDTEEFGYLLYNFEQLQAFLWQAAERHM